MTIFMQLTGRLGNQLFQIATGYGLAKENGTDFFMIFNKINKFEQEYISYFPDINFLDRQKVSRNIKFYSEKVPGINFSKYNKNLKKINNVYLDGYFQNCKYFNEYLPDLKKLFLKNIIPEIDGYFIHVRRGDYVNNKPYEINYISYFKEAIKHFPEDSKFFIVSDDISFCKTWDLFDGLQKEFMELNTLDTFHFMAGCKGGICANSSFSWWGAFLGKREIVTMPKEWINNGMDTSDIYFENVKVIDF